MLIPTRFIASKEASYISNWNEIFHKMEYVFNAMNAHADSDIIKGFNRAKNNLERENFMMNLVKPYLRISEGSELKTKYVPFYMNGTRVSPEQEYYFDNLYVTKNNIIVGIKDVKDNDIYHPAFIMMFDVNGTKSPNTWGKDIFGINIYIDGKIASLGVDKDLNTLKQDCSREGSGIFCSYYYRIGGDFNE